MKKLVTVTILFCLFAFEAVFALEKGLTNKAYASDGTEEGDIEEDELDLDIAAKETQYCKSDDAWDCPLTGFFFTVPEEFRGLKGQAFSDDNGEITPGSGVFHARLYYVPSEDKKLEALVKSFDQYDPDNDPDGSGRMAVVQAQNRYHEYGYMPFLDIVAVRDGISLDYAKEEAWISESTEGNTEELGRAGDFTFYCIARDYSSMEKPLRESFTDEYYDELILLTWNADKIADSILIKEPIVSEQDTAEDTRVSFETQDLKGVTVNSEDLFAGYKVTMINIWATWCGPCKAELPELEKLNKELAGKDCQIIGICDDTADDKVLIAEAQTILEENGVTFTNLIQTDEIRGLLPTSVYPISFFVDSEGIMLVHPVEGANPKLYAERIEEALQAVKTC